MLSKGRLQVGCGFNLTLQFSFVRNSSDEYTKCSYWYLYLTACYTVGKFSSLNLFINVAKLCWKSLNPHYRIT